MKRAIKNIILGACAAFSAACVSEKIDVTDNSIPKAVSFTIINEEEEWEINTSRIVSVSLSPDTAVAENIEIRVSDSSIMQVEPTEYPMEYKLTALAEGNVSIYAYADDLKSKQMSFTVIDSNSKPEPKIKVYISKVGSTAAKQDYGPWVTVKYGEQYIVSASCNRKDLTLELYSSSERVASFEEFGKDAWLVSAKFPGQTDLQVYVMDGDKEYFSGHEFVVYGEITLQAECSPVFSKTGFSIVDNPFGDLMADLHIDMTLVGWPYNDDKNQHKINVPPFETRNLAITDEGNYLTLYDFTDVTEQMYNTWTGGAINSGEHYTPHGAELNYVFKFDNSYITVKMLDDKDGERNWEFYTQANVKTEGVVTYE